jgi:hypothetical protein
MDLAAIWYDAAALTVWMAIMADTLAIEAGLLVRVRNRIRELQLESQSGSSRAVTMPAAPPFVPGYIGTAAGLASIQALLAFTVTTYAEERLWWVQLQKTWQRLMEELGRANEEWARTRSPSLLEYIRKLEELSRRLGQARPQVISTTLPNQLVGINPRESTGQRVNTELPGSRAEAEELFDRLTGGKSCVDPKTGHRVGSNGVRLRFKPDGSPRIDIPAHNGLPPETIHFNP